MVITSNVDVTQIAKGINANLSNRTNTIWSHGGAVNVTQLGDFVNGSLNNSTAISTIWSPRFSQLNVDQEGHGVNGHINNDILFSRNDLSAEKTFQKGVIDGYGSVTNQVRSGMFDPFSGDYTQIGKVGAGSVLNTIDRHTFATTAKALQVGAAGVGSVTNIANLSGAAHGIDLTQIADVGNGTGVNIANVG